MSAPSRSTDPWLSFSGTASFAWYFSVPLVLLLADGLIRSRVVLAFTWVEWSYYLASAVVMTAAYGAIIWLLRKLRRRPSRWPEAGMRVAVALACLLLLGAGYGAYFANGDLPDTFLLSYIRCEPKNALILFQDSVRTGYVLLLLLGVAGVSVWLGWACRFPAVVPLRGWRRGTLVAGMVWAALWYCWSGTANPHFPALRSGPTAVSGASRQKQILSTSNPQLGLRMRGASAYGCGV